ncbi:hypothetical protein [Kitasatospora sp. NPDC051705]|uniref:hypothetical protein n=1 Tax=Kitasatospora sp. NPDC051705 TaxID=3364057 RepID=UPI0037B4411E
MIRTDLADTTRERWEPWEPSLTVACIAMVMTETVLFDGGFTDFLEADAEETGLTQRFRELPAVGRGARWFADDDVLIRALDGHGLNARARTQPALERLRTAVPGDRLDG